MRKLMMTAAMAAVALGGAAACGTSSPEPSGTTQATTTTAADQTKEVCAQAISEGTTATAAIKTKVAEAMAAFSAGDQAKVLQITNDIKKTAGDWSTKLNELSNKPIKPEVKAALTDGITKINTLAAATTPPVDAEAKMTEFATKLAAACA